MTNETETKGPGRPRTFEIRIVLEVGLETAEYNRLRSLAEEAGTTMSAIARRLIRTWLARKSRAA